MCHLFCLEMVSLIVVLVSGPILSFMRVRIAKVVEFVWEEKQQRILLLKRHCCKVLQDPLNTTFVIWVPCKQIVLVSQCVSVAY